MEWLPSTIYASEALVAYVILSDGLAEVLCAIRHLDRIIRRPLRCHGTCGLPTEGFAISRGDLGLTDLPCFCHPRPVSAYPWPIGSRPGLTIGHVDEERIGTIPGPILLVESR